MPTSKTYGTPGAANQKIGGTPVMHYFDFASKGRGQVVRLMWEDAGIAYTDVRYEIQNEYPKFKAGQLKEWNPFDTIPVVELNGKILTQSYAIIRHFARVLGAYDGQTEDEKYTADLLCDAAIDWRTKFVNAFLSPNKDTDYPKHCKEVRPGFLAGFEGQLKSLSACQGGPYTLGKTISYADFVIYQVAHDESIIQDGRAGLKDYPRLKQLVDAIEARPGVQAFLKSDRYLG